MWDPRLVGWCSSAQVDETRSWSSILLCITLGQLCSLPLLWTIPWKELGDYWWLGLPIYSLPGAFCYFLWFHGPAFLKPKEHPPRLRVEHAWPWRAERDLESTLKRLNTRINGRGTGRRRKAWAAKFLRRRRPEGPADLRLYFILCELQFREMPLEFLRTEARQVELPHRTYLEYLIRFTEFQRSDYRYSGERSFEEALELFRDFPWSQLCDNEIRDAHVKLVWECYRTVGFCPSVLEPLRQLHDSFVAVPGVPEYEESLREFARTQEEDREPISFHAIVNYVAEREALW